MSRFAYVLFILIIIAALAVVLMAALIADTDMAGAAGECWHGCPPKGLRPALYLPYVGQEQPKWFDRDNAESVQP